MQIFTNAGQYVIRFGSSDPGSKTGPATMVEYHIKKQKRNYFPLMILFISLIFGGRYKSWKLLVH